MGTVPGDSLFCLSELTGADLKALTIKQRMAIVKHLAVELGRMLPADRQKVFQHLKLVFDVL